MYSRNWPCEQVVSDFKDVKVWGELQISLGINELDLFFFFWSSRSAKVKLKQM